MNNLWLIRGLPGSGKSTIAEYIQKNLNKDLNGIAYCTIFSHDYRGTKAFKESQSLIESEVDKCMATGIPNIIVHNVMSEGWEYETLIHMAEDYDYRIFSLVVEDRHGSDSVHTIPQQSLNRAEEKFKIQLNQGNIR